MTDDRDDLEIKDYAGGWITERKHTDVPGFLKLAYLVIAAVCMVYFIVYMRGETANAVRGALVRQFNSVTGSSEGFMYAIVGLIVVFAVVVAWFAFRRSREG